MRRRKATQLNALDYARTEIRLLCPSCPSSFRQFLVLKSRSEAQCKRFPTTLQEAMADKPFVQAVSCIAFNKDRFGIDGCMLFRRAACALRFAGASSP